MTKGLLSGEFMARAFNASTSKSDKDIFLGAIAKALKVNPELAEQSFDVVKNAIDDKDHTVRAHAHKTLADIIRCKPELADSSLVTKVTKAAIYDIDGGPKSAAGDNLIVILGLRPEFASNAFIVAKDAMNGGHTESAFSIMTDIINIRPDFTDSVLSLIPPDKHIKVIYRVLDSLSPK